MRLRILIIAAIVILPAHLPAQTVPTCSPKTPCIQVCTGTTATSCTLTLLSTIVPHLSIGTVLTLPAGNQATANITGEAPYFVLDLAIPMGSQGNPGGQGPPGPLIKGLTVSTDGLTLTWNGTFVTTGAGQGSITLDGFALTCKQASVGAAVPICTKQ
jgi:hypothetical protein